MIFTFTIEGKPVAKGRPRLSRYGTYTPPKTVEYEKKVKESYISQGGMYFDEQPLEMRMTFIFPITKSWKKSKREDAMNGRLPMTSKPDIDNLIKSVMDGLLGVCYKDDSQVINVIANKEYGTKEQTIVWLKSV